MAKYKLTENGVQNTETTAFIPNDKRNNDWNEYQNWLKGLGPDLPPDLNGKSVKPKSLGTGPNTPDPQFTPEELVAQAKQEEDQINEEKIQTEIKRMAISNLKAAGELPADYKKEK